MQKLKYFKSSRSTRSKRSYSAESRKDQEIKKPGTLNGGFNCGVKVCGTGILSKNVLAARGQLFPRELRDTLIPLG